MILFLIALSIISKDCYSHPECVSSITSQSCVTFDVVKHGIQNPELYYFQWEFGDGKIGVGTKVDHCYVKPGTYKTILSLMNKENGVYFEDELQIKVQILPHFSIEVEAPSMASKENVFLRLGLLEGDQSHFEHIRWTINELELDVAHSTLDELMKIGSNRLKAELLLKSGVTLCAEKKMMVLTTDYSHDTRFLKDRDHYIHDSLKWSGNTIIENGELYKIASVFFDSHHNILSSRAKQILKNNVQLLKKWNKVSLQIGSFTYTEGHYDHNRKRSMHRSELVRHYLMTLGLSKDQISMADPNNDASLKNTCESNPDCDFIDTHLNWRTDIKIKEMSP